MLDRAVAGRFHRASGRDRRAGARPGLRQRDDPAAGRDSQPVVVQMARPRPAPPQPKLTVTARSSIWPRISSADQVYLRRWRLRARRRSVPKADAVLGSVCELMAADGPIWVVTGADAGSSRSSSSAKVARERLGLEADVSPGGHLIALRLAGAAGRLPARHAVRRGDHLFGGLAVPRSTARLALRGGWRPSSLRCPGLDRANLRSRPAKLPRVGAEAVSYRSPDRRPRRYAGFCPPSPSGPPMHATGPRQTLPRLTPRACPSHPGTES